MKSEKSEKLMECIGQIDDHIIAEADVNLVKVKPVKRSWKKWLPVVAAAACMIIVISAMFLQSRGDHIEPPVTSPPEKKPNNPGSPGGTSDLPKLSADMMFGDMGFQGHSAYDVSELYGDNPWTENNKLTTLPVFQNPVKRDLSTGNLIEGGLSEDEMIAKAKEIAVAIGLDMGKMVVEKVWSDGSMLRIDFEETSIAIDAEGSISISFEKGVTLPEEYSLAYSYVDDNDTEQYVETTEEQVRNVMEYLLEQYASVVGIKSPVFSPFGSEYVGGYQDNGERWFSYSAYEGEGDLVEKILGYNFKRIDFFSNENGDLDLIRRSSDYLLSQKIGDYPIITAEAARKLLMEKHYITTVPEEYLMLEEKYVSHVELVYHTYTDSKVFMPYYEFLIELPIAEEKLTTYAEHGLKTFGVYYVPAVKSEYLEELPAGEVHFN